MMIFLIFLIVLSVNAKSAYHIKELTSEILGKKMLYAVYLPDGYTTEKKYPIIYALHGMGTDHTVYQAFTNEIDDAIKNGVLRPVVIAVPQAFDSFFVNNYNGTFKFEDYFFEEFVPHIESTYSIDAKASKRSVFGVSMGGFGAAYYSLIHQEMFTSSVAMSPALLPKDAISLMQILPDEYKEQLSFLVDIFSTNEYFNEHNFEHIVSSHPKKTYKTPIYGCIGQDDFLYMLVSYSGEVMKDAEMNYVWEDDKVGAHDFNYWKLKLPTVFKFIEDNFKKHETTTNNNNTNKDNGATTFSIFMMIMMMILLM